MSGDGSLDGAVLALSGGIGGAKLALGLAHVLPPGKLLVVGNTGDDFEHLGLRISPDLDTVMYTLAGLNNQELGWGLRGETWNFMAALTRLGGEDWFRLGDADLATHVERTRRLRRGRFAVGGHRRFPPPAWPRVRVAADDGRHRAHAGSTASGWLDFQDYFVRRHCEPVVSELVFEGAAQAVPQPRFLAALRHPGLRAVVICPSNPFISIEPILAVPGIRDAIAQCPAPVIAVSPIIGGQAVKGPTAKIMAELGMVPSAAAASARYRGLLDGFVLDAGDAQDGADHFAAVFRAPTLMTTLETKVDLARTILGIADSLR